MLRVKYKNTLSKPYYPTSSVAQGSLLGNLFFLIMIDGVTKVINHSFFQLYADDLKIFRPISCPSDVLLLQEDLDRIQTGLSDNNFAFSPEKCELVQFTRRQK